MPKKCFKKCPDNPSIKIHQNDCLEYSVIMEKNETEINFDKDALLKNFEKENSKTTESSNAESAAKCDEKEVSDLPEKDDETIGEESEADSTSRNSPEPSCAICLEQLQNKSFADTCFHTFCFTCLVEWSKVKPECPLCKQRFKSIVYNVRSVDDYDQYVINSKKKALPHYYSESRPSFRYRTTLSSDQRNERNTLQSNLESNYHQEIASHRMRYAPHSIRSLITNSPALNRRPCPYRQWIYNQSLWVKNPTPGRSRTATPLFYQMNPACTHRLVPWLNRELVVLLENEDHVTFVLEIIMALINRYDIRGREFFLHVEPYLGDRTAHFIHEFYTFATSPFDMETYDRQIDYSLCQPENVQSSFSDNDVIMISQSKSQSDENLPKTVSNERLLTSSRNNYKKLKKMLLKRNSSNNLWESSFHSVSSPSNNVSCILPNDRPSTSHLDKFTALLEAAAAVEAAAVASLERSEFKNDDECMIVDVVKPKNERTPEIIDLSSGEECNTVFDILSEDESSSPKKSTFYQIEPLDLTVGNESTSSDIELVFVKEKAEDFVKENEESTFSITSSPIPSTSKSSEHKKSSSGSSTTLLSAENEKSSFSSSNPFHFLKNHETYLSTESDSEITAEKPAPKKLKLRSVIAHFSVDCDDSRRRDSGHHSSHKRHKEKKKKKKKHSHKRKYRIYSDSD